MKFIRRPLSLYGMCLILMLTVAWVALEVILITRGSFWAPPSFQLKLWCGFAILAILPGMVMVWKANRFALDLIAGSFIGWLLISFYFVVTTSEIWLAFFTLGIAIYGLLVWTFCRQVLGKSYLDRGVTWYQGRPSAIPDLKCHFEATTDRIPLVAFKVSRIDRDGAFLFMGNDENPDAFQPLLDTLKRIPQLRVDLSFQGAKILCAAHLVGVSFNENGIGVKFDDVNSDQGKELGDLVERLSGVGYVS